MHGKRSQFLIAAGLLVVLASQPIGCSRNAGTMDQWEERDPMVRRAIARKNMNDIDGAIALYNKALERKPTMALAHLELGLLYDANKQDYIRAIYHYERYLELRPQAEKRKLIEDLIRTARLSFAASLPETPSGAVEQIAVLKREIEVLKRELDVQHPGSAQPAATASAAPAAPSEKGPQPPKPEPAQPAVQTYVVQPGDTLLLVAKKVYKDPSKWKAIFDANRSTLASPQSVRVGQTLIIPR